MILRVLKKIVYCRRQHLNIRFFRNSILTYIYSICKLRDFQKLKKDLENLFLAVARLILEKNILQPFFTFFKKIDIITDVIISIAAILKIFFVPFFCNISKYDSAKFHVKSIFLLGYTPGGTMCLPWSMIRQKYLWADRVNVRMLIKELLFVNV